MKRFAVIIGMLLAAACAYASPIPGPDFTNPVNVTLLSFSGGAWQNGYPYTLGMSGITGPIEQCAMTIRTAVQLENRGKPILRTWEATT